MKDENSNKYPNNEETLVYGCSPPDDNFPDDYSRLTLAYGTRRPNNKSVKVYGCAPYNETSSKKSNHPNTKEIDTPEKRNMIKYIASSFSISLAERLYFHIFALNATQLSTLKYIFEANEKTKKIRYIREKAQGIDEFINVNLSIIHNELNDVSDDMLSFIYNIVKLTCEEQSPNLSIPPYPQDIDSEALKKELLSIIENILKESRIERKPLYDTTLLEILESGNPEFLFYLREILKKQVL